MRKMPDPARASLSPGHPVSAAGASPLRESGTLLCATDGSHAAASGMMLAAELASALELELLIADGRSIDCLPGGLAQLVRQEEAALVVVSAERRSVLGAALIANVASELPGSAPCPIVAVPPLARIPRIGGLGRATTLVCGVDTSRAARRAVESAGRLAERISARVALVHARHPSGGPSHGSALLLHRAIAWTACPEDRVELVLDAGDAPERLQAAAATRAPAMIVVGYAGSGSGTLGSTSRTLAIAAGHPVMIVGPRVEAMPVRGQAW